MRLEVASVTRRRSRTVDIVSDLGPLERVPLMGRVDPYEGDDVLLIVDGGERAVIASAAP